MNITVNGSNWNIGGDELTYEEVTDLAFASTNTSVPRSEMTVSFGGGIYPQHEGTLVPGESVPIQDGMDFDVVFTGNA